MSGEFPFTLSFENFIAYTPEDFNKLSEVDLPCLNKHFHDDSLIEFLGEQDKRIPALLELKKKNNLENDYSELAKIFKVMIVKTPRPEQHGSKKAPESKASKEPREHGSRKSPESKASIKPLAEENEELKNCKSLQDYRSFINGTKNIDEIKKHLRPINDKNIDFLVALLTYQEHNAWVQKDYGEKIVEYFRGWQKDVNKGEKFYEVAKIHSDVSKGKFTVLFATSNAVLTLSSGKKKDLDYGIGRATFPLSVTGINIYHGSDTSLFIYTKEDIEQ